MTSLPTRQALWIVTILGSIAANACVRGAAPPVTGAATTDADLARLRNATAPFASLDSAVAAGYPRALPDCIIHEHHGAMGYHHVNRALLTRTLDVTKPQILLYERRPDQSYRFNGVEFILPYRLYSRDSVAPVLFGQRLHREDNFKYWYLHVWSGTNNSEGLFANFNPDVSCPAGTGKVYTPVPLDG